MCLPCLTFEVCCSLPSVVESIIKAPQGGPLVQLYITGYNTIFLFIFVACAYGMVRLSFQLFVTGRLLVIIISGGTVTIDLLCRPSAPCFHGIPFAMFLSPRRHISCLHGQVIVSQPPSWSRAVCEVLDQWVVLLLMCRAPHWPVWYRASLLLRMLLTSRSGDRILA